MSNTAHVCIFEDQAFSADVEDIPTVLGFNARRVRSQRGWTFQLHRQFCPENDLRNSARFLIRTPRDYETVLKFVQKITGYGCLFFDCKFTNPADNGAALVLTHEQNRELTALGVGATNMEIGTDAFPGLYLALKAAQNDYWKGAVLIASSASGNDYYTAFANALQAVARGKMIRSLGSKLTHLSNPTNLRNKFDEGIVYFLRAVGDGNPGKERLHPPGSESWFPYRHENGDIPPHEPNDFFRADNASAVKTTIHNYIATILGCSPQEASAWLNANQHVYDELKKAVGAVAKVHAGGNDRGPSVFSLLWWAAACCPNAISWLREVTVPQCFSELFRSAATVEAVKDVFDQFAGENGLFQRILIWDTRHCPNRTKNEPVIKKVKLESNLLTIFLHEEFSVKRLKTSNRAVGQRLTGLQKALNDGAHPLEFATCEIDNALLFTIRS